MATETVVSRSPSSRRARPAASSSTASPVAVVRIDDDVYAIGDICSHANVSLSEGEVWCDEREIECPKHGSTFSLADRRAADAAGHPAGARLPRPTVDGDTVDDPRRARSAA